MKKVLLIAAVFILLITGIYLVADATTVFFGDDGYAISDKTIERNLQSANTTVAGQQIDTVSFSHGDRITVSHLGTFIGQGNTAISDNYPLFIKNGEYIMTRTGKAKLIAEDFTVYDAYPNMYLAGGRIFDENRVQTDEGYILLLLPNNLYVSAVPIYVETKLGIVYIPQHSIFNPTETFLSFYSLTGDKLAFSSATALGESSTIQIGDDKYTYHGFLDLLGKLVEKVEEEDPKDPFIEIPEEVRIDTEGQRIGDDGSYPPVDPSTDPGVVEPPDDTDGGDGGEVVPGGTPGQPAPYAYRKPTAEIGEFSSSVYGLQSSVKIVDFAKRMYKGVKIEASVDGVLYMRKSYMTDAVVILAPLKPGQTFDILVFFDYFDEKGEKKRETIYEGQHSTLDINNLTALSFTISNGDYLPTAVSFVNMEIESGVEGDINGAAETANAIYKCELTVGSAVFSMPASCVNAIKESLTKVITASYVSGAVLNSDKSYDYSIKLYDRYGNILPLVEEVSGTTRTCKLPPEAIVTISANRVADVSFSVTLENVDDAELSNTYFAIHDMSGVPVITRLEGESSPRAHFPLVEGTQTLNFPELDENAAYYVEVISTYDTNDGKGVYPNVVIGSAKLTTLPITALGYAFFTNDISTITQTDAMLHFTLDAARTDPTLMFLLDRIDFEVYAGATCVWSVSITENGNIEAMNALKNGGDYTGDDFSITGGSLAFTAQGLSSATEYTISVTPYATQGTKSITITDALSVSSFKTLRAIPTASIANVYTTENSIELFNILITDNDGAISSKVTLQLRDALGALVATAQLPTNETVQRTRFAGLNPNEQYTITFYAQNINFNYLNSTAQTNYRFNEQYTVKAQNSVTGKLSILGLYIHDEETGELRGQNLFDKSTVTYRKYIVYTSGNIAATGLVSYISDLIPVTEGSTYAMSNFATGASGVHGYLLYDGAGNTVRMQPTQSAYGRIVIPEGVTHIRLSGSTAYIDNACFAMISSPNEGYNATAFMKINLNDEYGIVDGSEYEIRIFKNNIRAATIRNTFLINEAVSDFFSREMKIDPLKPDTWRIELWVSAFDYDIRLDMFEFEARDQLYGISNARQLCGINAFDLYGNYIVTEDIRTTSSTDFPYIESFGGTLDFQGHSLYVYNTSSAIYQRVVGTLLRGAEIKNLRFVVEHPLTVGPICFLVSSCYGTISDIIVELSGTVPELIDASENPSGGVFSITNTLLDSGIVERFSVDLGGDFYAGNSSFGFIALYHHGIIRDGRVFGGDLYSSGTYSGYIAGYTYTRSFTSNIIVEGNVYNRVTDTSKNAYLIGGLPARHRIENCIAVGDAYRINDITGEYELVLDRNALTASNALRGLYHCTDNVYVERAGISTISLQALHNVDWYKSALEDGASAFSFTQVPNGYYPTVVMNECMPQQELTLLPALERLNMTTLETIVVTEQYNDYAIALFTFINNSAYSIRDIDVEYLDADVISQSTVDGISTVKVRLAPYSDGDNPTKYISRYNVLSFTRATEVIGISNTTYLAEGDHKVNAEFFKPISDEIGWANINSDVTQNYRLTNDIYLESLSVRNTILFRNSTVFSGKLDGDGYTVYNADLGGSYSSIFFSLSGTVRDITFDNIHNTDSGLLYSSLIYQCDATSPDCLVSNVCVKNSTFTAYGYVSALVGVATGATIEYCSSINNTLTLVDSGATSVMIGGLVAYANESTVVTNCFVSDVFIDGTAATLHYAGGFAGRSSKSRFENCYSTGEIVTSITNAAGFVGNAADSAFSYCWADVSVTSKESLLGGFANGASEYTGSLALGDVTSTATGGYVYRFRGDSDEETMGTYALATQKINSIVSTEKMGVVELLTEEQLRDVSTYTELFGWDETVYDFSGLENYILPKLLYRDGTLMPGQPDRFFSLGNISVSRITAGNYNGEYLVHVEFEHPSAATITNITFNYLDVELYAETHNQTTTIFDFRVLNMTRMLDTYLITSLSYTAQGYNYTIEISEKVDFGEIFYNEIGSAAEWQTVMAERGANYENFLITGDIDFSSVTGEVVHGIAVNRLEGFGTKTISNVTLGSNGNNDMKGLINAVTGNIANISFENITITNISNRPRTGIISRLTGTMSNVTFTDCTIAGITYYTGCIGSTNASVLNNVVLDNVTVTSTTNYTGVLAGEIRYTELNSVTLRNCSVNANHHTGGIAGASIEQGNYGHLLRVENTDVTGATYVGGVFGSGTLNGTEEKCDEDIVVTHCNITANNYVCGVIGSGATRYFGSMELYNDGLYAVHVSYCNITGNDNVFGAVGSTFSTSGDTLTAFFYSGHNVIEALAGGAYGVNSYYGHYSLSEHNLIIATKDAAGVARNHGTNSISRNNQIFGSYNVGGASSGGVMWNSVSADNIISTIHDDLFTQVTGREKVGVTDILVQNRNIGGILGNATNYYCRDSISINCTIGAEGATNVGGVVGDCAYSASNYSFYNLVSIDCNVLGNTNVGGIAGTFVSRNFYTNASNSTVSGQYNVGGLIGFLDTSLTPENTSLNVIRYSYFTGTVSGYMDVGGLYGSSNYIPRVDRIYSILIAGEISSDVSGTAYLVGKGLTEMTSSRVYEYATVNNVAPTFIPTGMLPVTSADLADSTTYTNSVSNGGMGWGKTTFSYTGLPFGYMPYIKTGIGPLPYQEGKDASGEYYSVRDTSYDGGIAIPTSSSGSSTRISAAVPNDARLPAMSWYTSGADCFNMEFDCINPAATFEVYAGDTAVITSSINERVYTVRYDFSEPLKVVVSFFGNTMEYTVYPSYLKQVFSLWQDGWYILIDNGIQCGGEVLFGEFLNLYKNEALASDGNVYDVTDGTVVRTTGAPSLIDAVPLWKGSYEGAEILTYYGFSLSDDTINEGIRLIVKDGELFAIAASRLYDHTGIIADVNLGLSYLTVLLEEGKLLDINTPIVLPDGFELEFGASNIAEISSNIDSSLSYLFIRYKSGRMLAFDYLTGERLDITLPAPSMSLLSYVGDFIDRSLSVPSVASGYNEIVEVVGNIVSEDPKVLASLGVGEGGRIAADGSSNADGTGNGSGTAGANKYTPVYNVETDSFEVFEQTELIAAPKAVSVDAKLKKTDMFTHLYGDEKKEIGLLDAPDYSLTGGGVIIISVAVVIFMLLVGLYIRFRKARAVSSKNKGENR